MPASRSAALRASLLPFAIAIALPVLAGAQSRPSIPHPDELDAVVVTGLSPDGPLHFETDPRIPRQPVPASDGADYLKTIPGFNALRNGGTNGDPVLRGQSGSRLGLLSNDGVLIGGCPERMDNAMSYVAPETYDHLVVTKGPQTVLWGPGASAGTVRFVRGTPRFEHAGIQGSGSLLAASANRRDATVDVSAGTPRAYLRVDGNHSQADDYRDGDGRTVPSAWNKWSTDAAVGWTPDADTVIEAGAGHGNGWARYAGRGMDGREFKRDSSRLHFARDNMDGLVHGVDATLYRNRATHVMDNFSFRAPDPNGPMPEPMSETVGRTTEGGRLAVDLEHAAIEGTIGMDLQRSTHRGLEDAMDGGAENWKDDARFRNTGLFAEATWTATSNSRVVAGLRRDQARVTDLRTTTSQMADVNPTAAQARRATLGSGFLRFEQSLARRHLSWFAGVGHVARMPDFWELFSAQSGPEGAPNAFAGIRPERTTQLDAGIEYRTPRVDAWVNTYAGRIHDAILFDYLPGGMMGTTTRARNVDAAIRGFEAGVDWHAGAGWTLGGSVSDAWGANRSDHAWMPQMSPTEGRLSASWQRGRLTVGGLLRGALRQSRVATGEGNVSSRDLGPTPGFAVAAVNCAWKFNDRLQLTAGVDNLFDHAYAQHLNLAGSADFGYPADPVRINEPGRTAWLKLNVSM